MLEYRDWTIRIQEFWVDLVGGYGEVHEKNLRPRVSNLKGSFKSRRLFSCTSPYPPTRSTQNSCILIVQSIFKQFCLKKSLVCDISTNQTWVRPLPQETIFYLNMLPSLTPKKRLLFCLSLTKNTLHFEPLPVHSRVLFSKK